VCQNPLKIEKKDAVSHLEEWAKNTGARVEEVSTETQEGAQFAELGGIGAFLRYKFETTR